MTGKSGSADKMKHPIAARVMKPGGRDIATAVSSNGRVCQKSVFLELYLSVRALLSAPPIKKKKTPCTANVYCVSLGIKQSHLNASVCSHPSPSRCASPLTVSPSSRLPAPPTTAHPPSPRPRRMATIRAGAGRRERSCNASCGSRGGGEAGRKDCRGQKGAVNEVKRRNGGEELLQNQRVNCLSAGFSIRGGDRSA